MYPCTFRINACVLCSWSVLSRWRFIPFVLCLFLLPDLNDYIKAFDVESPPYPEETNDPPCRKDCDISIFTVEDMKTVFHRNVPVVSFLLVIFLCCLSNEFIKTCQPFLMKIYLFIFIPFHAIILIASLILVLVTTWAGVQDDDDDENDGEETGREEDDLKMLRTNNILLLLLTLIGLGMDSVTVYQLVIRRYKLPPGLEHLLFHEEGTEGFEGGRMMTILGLSNKLSTYLKLLEHRRLTIIRVRKYECSNQTDIFVRKTLHDVTNKAMEKIAYFSRIDYDDDPEHGEMEMVDVRSDKIKQEKMLCEMTRSQNAIFSLICGIKKNFSLYKVPRYMEFVLKDQKHRN